MSDLLAKVGRDPKTCSSQIEAFCRGIPGAREHDPFDGTESKGARSTSSDTEGAQGRRASNGEGRGGGRSRRRNGRGKRKGRRKSNRKGRGGETSRGSGRGRESSVHGPSTACLAEVLVHFCFVFEGAGAATKPTVAEAFAMLRLHAQPAEARAAGEMAEK